mmetsp:Transcript_2215/g.6588  ORF Transcript_2215/g.6588 Transcript_2215/m.6588 type:complete len:572 (-) Transcript_2215:31-1746(-)
MSVDATRVDMVSTQAFGIRTTWILVASVFYGLCVSGATTDKGGRKTERGSCAVLSPARTPPFLVFDELRYRSFDSYPEESVWLDEMNRQIRNIRVGLEYEDDQPCVAVKAGSRPEVIKFSEFGLGVYHSVDDIPEVKEGNLKVFQSTGTITSWEAAEEKMKLCMHKVPSSVDCCGNTLFTAAYMKVPGSSSSSYKMYRLVRKPDLKVGLPVQLKCQSGQPNFLEPQQMIFTAPNNSYYELLALSKKHMAVQQIDWGAGDGRSSTPVGALIFERRRGKWSELQRLYSDGGQGATIVFVEPNEIVACTSRDKYCKMYRLNNKRRFAPSYELRGAYRAPPQQVIAHKNFLVLLDNKRRYQVFAYNCQTKRYLEVGEPLDMGDFYGVSGDVAALQEKGSKYRNIWLIKMSRNGRHKRLQKLYMQGSNFRFAAMENNFAAVMNLKVDAKDYLQVVAYEPDKSGKYVQSDSTVILKVPFPSNRFYLSAYRDRLVVAHSLDDTSAGSVAANIYRKTSCRGWKQIARVRAGPARHVSNDRVLLAGKNVMLEIPHGQESPQGAIIAVAYRLGTFVSSQQK